MDNKDKRFTSKYDDDMDWLDDDDDYLEDTGIIGSLLFGDKKKKKKKKQNISDRSLQESRQDTSRKQSPDEEKRQGASAGRRKVPADRTPVSSGQKSGTQNRKKTPPSNIDKEYDEYYHEDSRARRAAAEADSRRRVNRNIVREGSVGSRREPASSASVSNLMREVNNMDEGIHTRHEELRREAWERTQRNVAKAKAEVERLELEREQNAKEEARKLRVVEEMKRRQEKERTAQEDAVQNDEAPVNQVNTQTEGTDVVTESHTPEKDAVAEAQTSENSAEPETKTLKTEIHTNIQTMESDLSDGGFDDEDLQVDVSDESDIRTSAYKKDMMDMDALERIEKDIDENNLHYSESDTQDLELGEIGRALGFDAVELLDDEEEPEEEEESDSEKFFRENLLDEADPKVVNPVRKKIKIGTRVWAIAFVVLLLLFVLICVIYAKSYARMKYNEMDINEISRDQLIVNDGVAKSTSGYRTIVLYGVDSRDSSMDVGVNSDSIILVSINEKSKEIKLVSVYRDTLMEIASGAMDTTQKVNYAYQAGGPVTAINTLNINLDLNITDYVAVNFDAMASIIDSVGGVLIDITDEEINNFNKNLAEQISLSGKYSDGITEAGTYNLDGQQAVAYSRIRSTDKGDITRTERQRVVLMKIISKLLAADTGSIDAFVDISFKCISTSLNKDDIHELVKDMSGYKVVDTVGFPFSYSAQNVPDKGQCLIASDMVANVIALHEYLYGTSNYDVSSDARKISSSIEKETGVKAQKVSIIPQMPGDGISDGGKEAGDLRTITSPPKGMIVEE